MLEEISKILDSLPKEDRDFLLALYGDESLSERELAKKLNVSRRSVRYRRDKLLDLMRDLLNVPNQNLDLVQKHRWKTLVLRHLNHQD